MKLAYNLDTIITIIYGLKFTAGIYVILMGKWMKINDFKRLIKFDILR